MTAHDPARQMAQVVQLLDAGRLDDAREILLDIRRHEPRNRKVAEVLTKVEQAIAEQGGGRARPAPPPRPPAQQPFPSKPIERTPTAAADDDWDLFFEIGLFLVYLVVGSVGGGFIVPFFMGSFSFGLIVGAVVGVVVWFLREIY